MKHCFNIDDLRNRARRRLPRVMFDYLDGGAEDEAALRNNRAGYQNYDLVPRTLVDVSNIKLDTTIQGVPSSLPLVLAPTGGTRFFHHLGELPVAEVAAEQGLTMGLSTMSTFDIETVAGHSNCNKWFQVYVLKDRGIVRELIERARSSGYQALILTVDVQTSGQRERDLRNGLSIPIRLTMSSLFDIALHPNWWWHNLTTPKVTMANLAGKAGIGLDSATALSKWASSQLDPTVSFDDLAWLRETWGGPVLVKGIVHPDDARRALDSGATGIIISNHGGRQLDHAMASIDALPAIAEAVGDRTEVFVDGGIRRGTDIVKALALGAHACLIGRPFLYGLAAGGKAGVHHAIQCLANELKRAMMLVGCTDIAKLNPDYLHKR